MNPTKLLIGGTFIYVGAIFFFLLENAFTLLNQPLRTIGVILLIIGGIITIIGIFSDRKKNETIQRPIERNCLHCGKAIPFEARICPFCKFDFEQIKSELPKEGQTL